MKTLTGATMRKLGWGCWTSPDDALGFQGEEDDGGTWLNRSINSWLRRVTLHPWTTQYPMLAPPIAIQVSPMTNLIHSIPLPPGSLQSCRGGGGDFRGTICLACSERFCCVAQWCHNSSSGGQAPSLPSRDHTPSASSGEWSTPTITNDKAGRSPSHPVLS